MSLHRTRRHTLNLFKELLALHQNNQLILDEVCVLPDFRNKGLGFAICHHALSEGDKLGFKQALLGSSDAGGLIYLRLQYIDFNQPIEPQKGNWQNIIMNGHFDKEFAEYSERINWKQIFYLKIHSI